MIAAFAIGLIAGACISLVFFGLCFASAAADRETESYLAGFRDGKKAER
jgi:hypothetical protein